MSVGFEVMMRRTSRRSPASEEHDHDPELSRSQHDGRQLKGCLKATEDGVRHEEELVKRVQLLQRKQLLGLPLNS